MGNTRRCHGIQNLPCARHDWCRCANWHCGRSVGILRYDRCCGNSLYILSEGDYARRIDCDKFGQHRLAKHCGTSERCCNRWNTDDWCDCDMGRCIWCDGISSMARDWRRCCDTDWHSGPRADLFRYHCSCRNFVHIHGQIKDIFWRERSEH